MNGPDHDLHDVEHHDLHDVEHHDLHDVETAALVLGDGFLHLLELLGTGTGRQEAMTRSYNQMITRGEATIGLDPNTVPPIGYRHGTECINGLADGVYKSVMWALADQLPPLPPGHVLAVPTRLLFGLCWQVEAMRNHVVYGLPLGVAAQLGVDIAAGRRPRGSRKGHDKTPLPLDMVLREVRSTRRQVAATLALHGLTLPEPQQGGWVMAV